MEYDNTNKGVFFVNNRKKQDTDSDLAGHMDFEGIECWVNAWEGTSKAGNRYISFKIKRKEPGTVSKEQGTVSKQPETQKKEVVEEDNLPF